MLRMREAVAAILAVTATFGLAALSQVPYAAGDEDRAVLRLSWRTLGERVEECRPLTPEEEARLPRHMRPLEVCEGRVSPYRLRVVLDGRAVADDTVHGAGAREDRPIYVYREFAWSPGRHTLAVTFERLGGPPAGEGRAPARMQLETEVRAAPGRVLLVTYDPELRALVLRGE